MSAAEKVCSIAVKAKYTGWGQPATVTLKSRVAQNHMKYQKDGGGNEPGDGYLSSNTKMINRLRCLSKLPGKLETIRNFLDRPSKKASSQSSSRTATWSRSQLNSEPRNLPFLNHALQAPKRKTWPSTSSPWSQHFYHKALNRLCNLVQCKMPARWT